MNREDIIRMAREASSGNDDRNIFFDLIIDELEAFATLVASAERERLTNAAMKAAEKAVDVAIALEREACAKVCESIDMEAFGVLPIRTVMITNHCAEAIRARGQA